MNQSHIDHNAAPVKGDKILLVLFPYWPILIPPMGISSLKGYLRGHGYRVKTVDANLETDFKGFYDAYFEILKKHIPVEKRGNFYSIGQDVQRYHMLAHIHKEDQGRYLELAGTLIYKTFFVQLDEQVLNELDKALQDLFAYLEKYILDLVEREKPDYFGASVFKGSIATSMFGMRAIKKKYPHIRTLMGGGVFADQLVLGSPNLDYFLERTRDYIDKLFIGEGEQLLLEYLKGNLADSQRVYTMKDLDGDFLDIATIGPPDVSDFDLDYYPYLPAYGSRGCPFDCSFCSETVRWGKYRKKKASRVVEQVLALHKSHGSQLFLMTDSLLNPIVDDFSKELIEAGASVYWDGYLRADKHVCDTDKTMMWRKGGFYRCRLGIESGSPRVLEMMDKKITPEQIKSALSSLAYAGIKTSTLWIVGYPGETEADFLQTLELISECKQYLYDAEGTPFWYYISGQSGSDEWRDKSVLLYPQWAKEMLVIQEWIMGGEPSREETYDRLNRFVAHCNRLGIPNPYSLHDIYRADERWRSLHKNAVPRLAEFGKNKFIDENKYVDKLSFIEAQPIDEGDFGF